MLVARAIAWGFATAVPLAGTTAEGFELVHVAELSKQLQYCRVGLAEQEVVVLFLAGGEPADPDVAALASRFPHAAIAVVFDDSTGHSRAFALGTPASSAAAAVAIAKYNGTLDDLTHVRVEVDAVEHAVDIEHRDRVWVATVRRQTAVI